MQNVSLKNLTPLKSYSTLSESILCWFLPLSPFNGRSKKNCCRCPEVFYTPLESPCIGKILLYRLPVYFVGLWCFVLVGMSSKISRNLSKKWKSKEPIRLA